MVMLIMWFKSVKDRTPSPPPCPTFFFKDILNPSILYYVCDLDQMTLKTNFHLLQNHGQKKCFGKIWTIKFFCICSYICIVLSLTRDGMGRGAGYDWYNQLWSDERRASVVAPCLENALKLTSGHHLTDRWALANQRLTQRRHLLRQASDVQRFKYRCSVNKGQYSCCFRKQQ